MHAGYPQSATCLSVYFGELSCARARKEKENKFQAPKPPYLNHELRILVYGNAKGILQPDTSPGALLRDRTRIRPAE